MINSPLINLNYISFSTNKSKLYIENIFFSFKKNLQRWINLYHIHKIIYFFILPRALFRSGPTPTLGERVCRCTLSLQRHEFRVVHFSFVVHFLSRGMSLWSWTSSIFVHFPNNTMKALFRSPSSCTVTTDLY